MVYQIQPGCTLCHWRWVMCRCLQSWVWTSLSDEPGSPEFGMASAGPSTGWYQNWNGKKQKIKKKKKGFCLCIHLNQVPCVDPNTVSPTCSKSVVGHSRSCIETGNGSPDQLWSRQLSHHESGDHNHRQRSSNLSPGAGNRSSQTSWTKQKGKFEKHKQ